ncbi:MAG: N-acetyl-gamma-glutamyl-phosphate reductase [Ruminococcaceae bacterium]|nr:N-acetyl-gamma-glutamyl-phosphate reductase [Oscillospiraceae bacterium]
MYKVFIDGGAGTTGLRLRERLLERNDIELLTISEELRKDDAEKKKIAESSDITFLCLPDEAAKAAAGNISPDAKVKIIDASTAHRTNPAWLYGFPELSKEHRQGLESANRVAVPGCHASGFNVIAYPLVKLGLVGADYPFVCTSLTGYSGGGKSMIAEYEAEERKAELEAPRTYAIAQKHKHLPEMQAVPGILSPPIFMPVVGDFYSGMEVSLPIYASLMEKKMTAKDVYEVLCQYYDGQKMISVLPFGGKEEESGFFASNALSGKDNMEILVAGNDERILIMARYDNLGKGASGAAVQCMNIMLGCDESKGLVL